MKMQNSTIATSFNCYEFCQSKRTKNSETTGRPPSEPVTLLLLKFPEEFKLNSLAFQLLKLYGEKDQQKSQNPQTQKGT